MPSIDYTLTLNGAAQQLITAVPAATGGHGVPLAVDGPVVGGAYDVPFRTLSLQPDAANAGVIYVAGAGSGMNAGSGSGVSSSKYGFRLEVPVSSIPAPPYILGEYPSGPIKLSDIWVIGTNGDKLHIFGIEF